VPLGPSVVTAGVTSIVNSVDPAWTAGTASDAGPMCITHVEIRSGIAGTVVASPNYAAQADGTTSFADAQGNTWTLNAGGYIGSGVAWYSFYGEVFAFAPRWNEDRSNCTVPIEANGALRRLIGNDVQPRSYYRSWVNTHLLNPRPQYFWALEEGSDAGTGQPDIGGTGATFKNAPAGVAWGQAKMNDWIPNGVAIDNFNELHFPCDMRGSSASAWEVSMLLSFPDDATVMTGAIDCGVLTVGWSLGTDTVLDPDNKPGTGTVYVITPTSFDFHSITNLTSLKGLGPIWFTIRNYFSGTQVATYAAWKPVAESSNAITITTIATRTTPALELPRAIDVACVLDATGTTKGFLGMSALTVSECSAGTAGMSLSYIATKGAPGETTDTRFERMLDEKGINNSSTSTGAVTMGRQYIQGLEDHLLEILTSSEHSAILESRSANELALLGTGTYRGSIAYTEIVPDLEPVEDDKDTANIVRLSNSHSGQATLTKPTGDMSIAQVGPFERKLETNNSVFSHATAVAGKALALGTWPGPRFTEITVSAVSTPASYTLYRQIEVGDFFAVTGLSVAGYYDVPIFKVLSIREDVSQDNHLFTFTVRPGELDYRPWTLATNRVDIADSTVSAASSGSTVDVNVPTAKWANASAPFDVMISGERMTVTAVGALTSTTQRLTVTRSVNGVVKTVPVGAEVHLYPAFFIKAV
jgi:hypothetical protein